MGMPELRPLGVGETLDAAIKVYLRNAWTLMKIVAVVLVPVAVITALLLIATVPDDTVVSDGVFLTDEDAGGFIAANIVVGFLGGFATLLATGAAFRAVADAYLSRKPKARESLAYAGRRLHSMLWVGFLTVLVIGLGFLALVIPGIYLAVAFAVAMPALLLEDLKGTKALGRSRALMKGRWWPAFGVLLVGYLILPLILGLVVGFALQAVLFAGAESPEAYFVLSGIGNTLASIVSTPIQVAVLTILYFDLRVRKEGFDLELLVQRIGGEGPVPSQPPSLGQTTTNEPPRTTP